MKELIGKTDKELEEKFGFDYYLETKDDFILGKPVNSINLINSFIEFNKENELKVVKLYDGTIQEIDDMNLSEIKRNLIFLAEGKGIFYDDSDDELATAYGFLCDSYFAEIMESIIFFSGKEEIVRKFADVLDNANIEYHDPGKILGIENNIRDMPIKLRKLGRNELCHCGSGEKYKKCCLEKDIKENGVPMKVPDLWDDGYFAETLSPNEIKEKDKTIDMGHDEDMRFNCKKCNKKISAHNKDWHAHLCDNCFNGELHQDIAED